MAFERYGQVGKISMDKSPGDGETNRSCFLEMLFDHHGSMAIRELNGTVLGGNVLAIKESSARI